MKLFLTYYKNAVCIPSSEISTFRLFSPLPSWKRKDFDEMTVLTVICTSFCSFSILYICVLSVRKSFFSAFVNSGFSVKIISKACSGTLIGL